MTERQSHSSTARPTIVFYSRVFLRRYQNFLYHQIRGITSAHVAVVATRGAHRDEFPVRDLFTAEREGMAARWSRAIARRMLSDRDTHFSLSRYCRRRILAHLTASKPDLVYCMFGWNACQILDVLERMSTPVPFVFHAAGSDVTSAAALGPAYLEKLQRAFARARMVLCGSAFLRDKLRELGAPMDKVRIHYIGVEVPPILHREAAEAMTFTILAVSRLTAVKGVHHTIGAFSRACADMPGARLLIVGDGPERGSCERLAAQTGVADRVHFYGEVPQSRVFALMRSAHLFVQHNVRTSRGHEEGLGGSALEAAAHGLPVVGTMSGGIPEAVMHERTGLLVRPGDQAEMCQAMVTMFREPELRVRYGLAGRGLVCEQFDRQRQNQRLDRVLYDACDLPSPRIAIAL